MPAAAQSFDLVVIADPRLRYADGRCLAALLATAAAHGYRTALLPVLGPWPSPAPPVHPHLAAVLAKGDVTLLDGERPHAAALALVYDLQGVRHPLERPWALRPERVLLRIDQPWRTLAGAALLPLNQALRHAAGLCLVQPELACADLLLRERLDQEGFAGALVWPPASGLTAVDGSARSESVGRHVAGGEGAWPAVVAHAGPVVLAEAAARSAPPGGPWLLHPGELDEPATFLASLGTYLLATDRPWRPTLLAGLAEALAAGVPLLAPPALERLLGPAAAYAEAEDVPAALREMTPARRSTLREAARDLHATLTSPAALVRRLEEHLGAPRPRPPRLTLRRELRTRRRALFLSPNGIGMGHLTRLLAVARRLGPELEPVFLSMSQAVGVVESMGYLGEYFPYHQHSGETADAWNAALRARLDEAIAFYDARCVVLDGNVPYQGLIECAAGHPNRCFVWIRRGLWREDAGRAALERARHFDLVIEPGELAAELDRGPTVGRAEDVLRTSPVVFHDPAELLTRSAARSALGLDPERTAVLVQLGSRNNFDFASIDQTVLEELASRPEIEVVVLDLADRRGGAEAAAARPSSAGLSGGPLPQRLRLRDQCCRLQLVPRADELRHALDRGAEREPDDGRAGAAGPMGGAPGPGLSGPAPRSLPCRLGHPGAARSGAPCVHPPPLRGTPGLRWGGGDSALPRHPRRRHQAGAATGPDRACADPARLRRPTRPLSAPASGPQSSGRSARQWAGAHRETRAPDARRSGRTAPRSGA